MLESLVIFFINSVIVVFVLFFGFFFHRSGNVFQFGDMVNQAQSPTNMSPSRQLYMSGQSKCLRMSSTLMVETLFFLRFP